jgi:hypothetical protein
MGFAVAGWLFYSIAAALEGDSYYLHWQPRDSLLTAIALVTLAAVWGLPFTQRGGFRAFFGSAAARPIRVTFRSLSDDRGNESVPM